MFRRFVEFEIEDGEDWVEVVAEVSTGWRGTYYDPPEPPEVLRLTATRLGADGRRQTVSTGELYEIQPDVEDLVFDALERGL